MRIHPRHALSRTPTAYVAFLVLAALVAVPQLAAGQSTDKVTICHIPPGNPANAHTIVVGAPAVPAHLEHLDHLGPCVCVPDDNQCGPGFGACCPGLVCNNGLCAPPSAGVMPVGGACTSDANCDPLNQCVFLAPDDGVCGG
jgi:hypothetical protein